MCSCCRACCGERRSRTWCGRWLTLAGRGRTRIAGAVLAALTGLLLIVFNSGFAAPWETFTIFALMFTGTVLYRAEAGQYPWRRALYVTVLVFGLTLVAVQWHESPLAENYVTIRRAFNSLEFAGLTFAVAMLCRHRTVPRALAWLGLVSYSVYLLHPALIEAFASVLRTKKQHFVPTELLLVAVFVLVLLVSCGLTHRFIEAPMQRLGRRVAGRLDARFGPDVPPPRRPRPDPAGSPGRTRGTHEQPRLTGNTPIRARVTPPGMRSSASSRPSGSTARTVAAAIWLRHLLLPGIHNNVDSPLSATIIFTRFTPPPELITHTIPLRTGANGRLSLAVSARSRGAFRRAAARASARCRPHARTVDRTSARPTVI
jgi:hypothetical protein